MKANQNVPSEQIKQTVPLRNPSQMDTYVHVTSPRTWLIAVALFLFLAALAFWGFFGRIPQYHETTGVGVNDVRSFELTEIMDPSELDTPGDDKVSIVLCLIEPNLYSTKQLNNKKANIFFRDGTTVQGTTVVPWGSPLSKSEVENDLAYWLVDEEWILSNLNIDKSKYWYLVTVILDTDLPDIYWGAICDVEIVTSEDTPISFLFKRDE